MTWMPISRDSKGMLNTRDGMPTVTGLILGSLLSGKALAVYSRLPNSEASDYYQLKEALLIHYQLTQEDYRKKFHSGTQTSMETATQYLARLEHFFDNWICLSQIELPLKDREN